MRSDVLESVALGHAHAVEKCTHSITQIGRLNTELLRKILDIRRGVFGLAGHIRADRFDPVACLRRRARFAGDSGLKSFLSTE
jgi:hypothetical protein